MRQGAPHIGDELVSAIYAAMLGETTWQSFLDQLEGLSPDSFSTFFHHDTRSGTGATTLTSGDFEDARRDYERHYVALNPWMKRVAATPLGKGVIGEQVVERAQFRRSEYYNDFIGRMGFETGIGLTLFRDNGRYLLLSMLTLEDDADLNLERAATLSQIAPHLARAFAFYRNNRVDAFGRELGGAVAAAAGVAMIVVDDGLKVVEASHGGEQVLSNGDLMGLTPTGRLRMRDAAMRETLRELVASRSETRVKTFAIQDVEVSLVRIRMEHAVEFFAGPRVAILVGRPAAGEGPGRIPAIAAACGLTASERRVFEAIASGLLVAEVAARDGVSEATVRTQLKAVFAKTATRNQVDLVRLAFAPGARHS